MEIPEQFVNIEATHINSINKPSTINKLKSSLLDKEIKKTENESDKSDNGKLLVCNVCQVSFNSTKTLASHLESCKKNNTRERHKSKKSVEASIKSETNKQSEHSCSDNCSEQNCGSIKDTPDVDVTNNSCIEFFKKCKLCKEKFNDKGQYLSHKVSCKKKTTVVYQNDFDQKQENIYIDIALSTPLEHNEIKTGYKTATLSKDSLSCSRCLETFQTCKEFNLHITESDHSYKMRCSICLKCFKSACSLKWHMKYKHS